MKPRSSFKPLTYEGPFIVNGNTWFDDDPPTLNHLPAGDWDAEQAMIVRRALLADRKANRHTLFDGLPGYLDRNRNGLLWRGAAMLYAYTLPAEQIELFIRECEAAIFKQHDPFVARWVHEILLNSGIPRFVAAAARVMPYLHPTVDLGDLARIYAVIIEDDVGFDPKSSTIVASAENSESFHAEMIEVTEAFEKRFETRSNLRVHAGVPFQIEETVLRLAAAIRSPYFHSRISFEKVLIEAYTGFDLSSGYDKLQLRPERLYEALVELSDRTDLGRYTPGSRYFFGEAIERS